MEIADIGKVLTARFGTAVSQIEASLWQVETEQFRLLVILSENQTWLRLLLPIAPLQEVQLILEQLLQANFDQTQETRYGLHQNVIWAIFQHSRDTLTEFDFNRAISNVISLQEAGFSEYYNQLIENRIREIIKVAKQQGQSIETTLQNLERFYAEGVMGDLGGSAEERERTLTAWRNQLERLWSEVE